MASERLNRAMRPDAQAFDEIRIKTVPRYKTSYLSGDEWRISASVEFWRKGKMVHETGYRNVETATKFLAADYLRACDDGKAYYAGEGKLCDQEGCAEVATVTYRIKKEYSRDNPFEWNKERTDLTVRMFCERHSTRGDCGFDDADSNYEVLSGTPNEPSGVDLSPSGQVTVSVNNLDELPAKIAEAKQNYAAAAPKKEGQRE